MILELRDGTGIFFKHGFEMNNGLKGRIFGVGHDGRPFDSGKQCSNTDLIAFKRP